MANYLSDLIFLEKYGAVDLISKLDTGEKNPDSFCQPPNLIGMVRKQQQLHLPI